MSGSGLEGLNKKSPERSNEFIGSNAKDWQHWKYPSTVGNDTGVDDINFNSNQTSEYAKLRMNAIDPMVNEPFIMFEFMKVDNDDYGSSTGAWATKQWEAVKDDYNSSSGGVLGDTALTGSLQTIIGGTRRVLTGGAKGLGSGLEGLGSMGFAQRDDKDSKANAIFAAIKDFAEKIGSLVNRKYMGSIALYMPTGISINDQMVYSEASRKMGAFAETLFSDDYADVFNPTTLTSTAAMTTAGFLAGKIPFLGKAVGGQFSALIGAGLAQVVGTELQMGSGKLANPNELLEYSSTAMRNFTFEWTILPDSQKESEHAAGLIKLFRKSAHARKDNKMIVTVPDHVIVSFHGAGAERTNMIQLPPCVIETVNVTYNPNTSSFFKQNNAPVEIGLSIGLREMAPIYESDIEAGY